MVLSCVQSSGGDDAAGGSGARASIDNFCKEHLLQQSLKDVDILTDRATSSSTEDRRILCESSRGGLKGSVRIMGRVRPPLANEINEDVCLRVQGKHQLEVLTEPRALLSDPPTSRFSSRRRLTTGCLGLRDSTDWERKSATPVAAPDSDNFLDSRVYTFDDLFDIEATDDDVFAAVRGELSAAVDGEAVCVLAYGATGSGKTHTVTNLAERAAQELERQAVALAHEGLQLEITIQIVEIYNQQLRDLLAGEGGSKYCEPPNLKLLVSNSSATLLGAATRTICSDRDGGGIAISLSEALRVGQAHRATSATAVHGRSSRSHLVMMLFLALRDPHDGTIIRVGKFSLVDLAGSERLKQSEAVGERLKEAQHINRSLSALADVISAKERRVAHVPYRNSKLTHLLQDALGGQQQCRTVVIVALTPTRKCIDDTQNSLQFSSRLTALSLPPLGVRRVNPQMRRIEQYPCGEQERAQLKNEVLEEKKKALHWKQEFEQAQTQLDNYRRRLEQMESEKMDFEQSKEKLFEGFVALNKRLQKVEASTLATKSVGAHTVSFKDDTPSSKKDGAAAFGAGPNTSRSNTVLGSNRIDPVLRTCRSVGSERVDTTTPASTSLTDESRTSSDQAQQKRGRVATCADRSADVEPPRKLHFTPGKVPTTAEIAMKSPRADLGSASSGLPIDMPGGLNSTMANCGGSWCLDEDMSTWTSLPVSQTRTQSCASDRSECAAYRKRMQKLMKHSSREYVVAELSKAQVREFERQRVPLSGHMKQGEPFEPSLSVPAASDDADLTPLDVSPVGSDIGSPALLLCPMSSSNGEDDDEEGSTIVQGHFNDMSEAIDGEPSVCISVSSDEGDIRERLRRNLNFRQSVVPETVASQIATEVGQRSASAGQAIRRVEHYSLCGQRPVHVPATSVRGPLNSSRSPVRRTHVGPPPPIISRAPFSPGVSRVVRKSANSTSPVRSYVTPSHLTVHTQPMPCTSPYTYPELSTGTCRMPARTSPRGIAQAPGLATGRTTSACGKGISTGLRNYSPILSRRTSGLPAVWLPAASRK